MEPAEAKKQQRFELPKQAELPPQVLLAMEKEVVGLYVSGHPLTRYQDKIQQWRTKLIMDINGEEYPDGSLVEILCIIESKKSKATRSGETMAFATVEDSTGSIETLIFPKVLSEHRSLCEEGTIVLLKARVSIREDEDIKLVALSMQDPETVQKWGSEPIPAVENTEQPHPEKAKKQHKPGLYLRVDSKEDPRLKRAQEYLAIFEGSCPLYIYFKDSKKMMLAPQRLFCEPNAPLLKQLKVLLGEKNVALVE